MEISWIYIYLSGRLAYNLVNLQGNPTKNRKFWKSQKRGAFMIKNEKLRNPESLSAK
jgi:hypothetical protein